MQQDDPPPSIGDTAALAAGRQSAIENGDPTALLLAEHEWIRSVLKELPTRSMATEGERLAVRGVLEDLGRELDVHMRKEEEAYFPFLEPLLAGSPGSTEDMYGEHDAIRIRHERLARALLDAGDIPYALYEFTRSLTVHFANEEELFIEAEPQRRGGADNLRVLQAMQAIGE